VLKWPDVQTVDRAVRRWAERVGPAQKEALRIGYFGSYARGDWGVGSDLDLAVVVASSERPFERRGEMWDTTELPVSADVLVYTEREWEDLSRRGQFYQTLAQEIVWVYIRGGQALKDSLSVEEGEHVGEVRIKARLTNAVDQALVRRGLLKSEQVRSYEADVLVDTGAVRCVLPPHVVERLGLEIVGQRVAEYADGRLEAVGLTEPFALRVLGREEVEDAMVLGDEVMIGQTVLEKLDLLVDCENQRLVPNPEHPDQPVSKVKQTRR